MATLLGRSEQDTRKDILLVTARHKLSVEEHFQNAAKEHAPELKPKIIRRKLQRFEEGCAAPDFVKRHTLNVLESIQGETAKHPSSQ
jgi:UTP-glucose-1-phosphate uridylyltransferase